jgi:hypothetical protein
MKKSNIILLSILVIVLLTIIALQIRFKSYIQNLNNEKIELSYNSFNEIVVEDGWFVEFYIDTITKVNFSSDSIKDFITLNDDKLILEKSEIDSKNRKIIKIFNPEIKQVKLSGNSRMYYYLDSIDTLHVNLKDQSDLILTGRISDDGDKNRTQSKINFLDITLSNESSISIYSDVNQLQGELKDTSYCRLTEKVNIIDFTKSPEANLNSW